MSYYSKKQFYDILIWRLRNFIDDEIWPKKFKYSKQKYREIVLLLSI